MFLIVLVFCYALRVFFYSLSFERERKAKKEDASFALLSSVVDSMDDREA